MFIFSEHGNDLTHIYYAKKLLPYLKHYYLEKEWVKFLSKPIEKQLYEEVATFFAQWYQPEEEISSSHISAELDNIAQEVMERMRSVHPIHPIFSVTQKQLSHWKRNNISKTMWNNKHSKQLLDFLCMTLSEKRRFFRASNDTDFFLINYVSYRLVIIIL